MFDIFDKILGPIVGVIDKFVPDKDLAAKLKSELKMSIENNEHALAMAQAATNTESAKHSSVFVAGARPFILWVCGIALAWDWILVKFVSIIAQSFGAEIEFPEIATSEVVGLTIVLIGGRSYEKGKGVARNKVRGK